MYRSLIMNVVTLYEDVEGPLCPLDNDVGITEVLFRAAGRDPFYSDVISIVFKTNDCEEEYQLCFPGMKLKWNSWTENEIVPSSDSFQSCLSLFAEGFQKKILLCRV